MSDRFEFLEQLGRGGMGTVWKARDSETGEVVALKLLHQIYVDDPAYVERFEREVEIAQRIDSAHVVTVLGFGRREGVPFVAMEYVEGDSLRERLKKDGPVSWEEAKRIATQISMALAAAHSAGVVHRDIKPSNVLMEVDGNVKLADFGIARAADLTRMTGSVTVLGTPAYLSPDRTPSAQSDLYSLGCLLYELLAGVPPFEGDSQQTLLLMHLQDPPNLERLPIPARRTIGWLLEKEPSRRPASAEALLAVLSGSSPPPALSSLAAASSRRRLSFVPLAAIGTAAIGAVLGGTALMWDPGETDQLEPTPVTLPQEFEVKSVDCLPTTVEVGSSISCDAVLGGASEGVTYSWAAEGGEPSEGREATFRTTFPTAGDRKRVILQACNASDDCVEKSAFISVNDPSIGPPPESAFTCAPNPTRAGEKVSCTALATGTSLTWVWEAPGSSNAAGSEQSFETTFAGSRTNDISMTVCRIVGEGRACATAKQTILLFDDPSPTAPAPTAKAAEGPTAPGSPTVSPPIIVSVLCNPAAPKLGAEVACSATVTGPVDRRTWLASGATPASGSAATFATRFASPGPKTILLEACNAGGCATGASSVAVSDVEPPRISLTCTPGVLQTGSPITCVASVVAGNVDSWSWNATGGNPSTGVGERFVATYNTYGSKSISVVGCQGSACATGSATFRVDPPWATPSNQPPPAAATNAPLQPTPSPTTAAIPTTTPVPGATNTPTPLPTATAMPGATNTGDVL